MRHVRGDAGISLVEVLVTIVIFLVGIVAVIRMFPSGFLSLKHSESYTLANRLAQAELERLQGRAANIPSGILSWAWDGAAFNIASLISPDDMGEQDHTGITPWPPPGIKLNYLTDVNKFRRIEGERTTIPAPIQTTRWDVASVYVVGFSPMMWHVLNPVRVYGGPMRRRWLPRVYDDAAILARLRTAADYAIDYDDGKLYLKVFPGNNTRMYWLSYSYWEGVSTTEMSLKPAKVSILVGPADDTVKARGFFEIDIPAPNPPFPDGTLVKSVSGFESIDNGSDTLARQFRDLTFGGRWSNDDPYEFKVVDRLAGTLGFNPIGYGYEEYTARGKEALTANVDYTVLDWHIIREERRVSDIINSPTDLDAKLTLRFIKESGQSQEPDGSNYAGLAPDSGLRFDVMAVDLDAGEWYTTRADSVVPGTNPQRPAMEVDYKEGIIHFDPGFWKIKTADPGARSPFQGKTFKIYYRAEGEWAVQTYKSYDIFRRTYGVGVNNFQYYFQDGLVHFAPCNAGTSVALDYAYMLPKQPEVFISGQVYEISKDNVFGTGGNQTFYIDLGDKVRQLYGPTAAVTRISRIYGVSVGVRVVWRESGRLGFAPGGWRKVELQTYLTRSTD